LLKSRTAVTLVGALSALALGAGGAQAAAVLTPYRDAVSYRADLTTTGNASTFSGSETIVVHNAGHTPLSQIWLRLWGNGPKGCAQRAVSVTAIQGGKAGRLIRACTALEITLPAAVQPGASHTLTLAVSMSTPAAQDRFGSVEGMQLYGNALPIVAQRDAGGWRLPPYSPYGESFVSSWAQFSLTLHHPAGIQVAASGTTTTTADPSGGTATTTSEIDARDTFWAAGDMQSTTKTTSRGVVIRAWSPPEAGADRDDAATDAVGAMEQLERHLPNYPYAEFDVIVAHIEAGGGMEYPGLVLSDGASDVTRHETAHQWFYGLVGDDQFREPWVDEGVTSFLEYTWTTKAELPLPACYPAYRLKVSNPTTFVTHSMAYWNAHVPRYLYAYNNPVCALRQVRRSMGAGKFDTAMRKLVTDYSQSFLTGAELRRAFRIGGGGAKTDRIFKRWGIAP
jgi:hypothetical protein